MKEDILAQILELVGKYNSLASEPQVFDPFSTSVPPSGKVISGNERAYMVEAALEAWLTTGRFNAKFEANLASYLGRDYALTVNSGSSANLVAFHALTARYLGHKAIKPGDEVITAATGFPTTVNPIMQFGAVPVFVDIEIPTYNIDVAKIEAAVTEKTKAIMIAHTLGNPFDVDAIRRICDNHGLFLIEDCCDALGSTYKGQKVGTFGDVGTLSFYPAHHITMGEGGAVFTNQQAIKRGVETFRDWGRDCYCAPGEDNTCGRRFRWKLGDLPEGYDHKYTYSHMGYNLKITDMQAACGLAQLEKVDEFVEARKQNFAYLKDQLLDFEDRLILPEATKGSDPSWFGFPITIRDDAKVTRDQMTITLNDKRIGTRLLFAGNLVRQPYMKGREYRVVGDLDTADQVMRDTFWVGIYPGLTNDHLDYTADSIKAILNA